MLSFLNSCFSFLIFLSFIGQLLHEFFLNTVYAYLCYKQEIKSRKFFFKVSVGIINSIHFIKISGNMTGKLL